VRLATRRALHPEGVEEGRVLGVLRAQARHSAGVSAGPCGRRQQRCGYPLSSAVRASASTMASVRCS
jgi:hypothetical protein